MPVTMIVSYDGTENDDDGLALGAMLSRAGAELILAYVRHSREFDARREQIAQHDAERRLEHGLTGLGLGELARHIVLSASTSEGLAGLAADTGASLIVFGSDYRTPPNHVEPGATAQNLLEGGRVAVAVAPAGLRASRGPELTRIATLAADGDTAVTETAEALAARLGGERVEFGEGADLVVVGSHASASEGRIALSGPTRAKLGDTRCGVIVLPRGRPIAF
jgi:nucleotide-binding universal stress UspA family protein